MDIARIKRFLAGMALLLPAGLAQAGNLNFNGGAVASCTLAGSQYTCSKLALGNWNDVVSISSGYAVTVDPGSVTFEYNQGLVMSGSAALTVNGSLNIGNINTPNLKISGGTLTARGGTFSMGAQVQTIVADVNAAALKIGTGSATKVTGNLSATGNVDITSNVTVIGTISGANVSTSAHIALTGNINATGAFTLESGSTLKGNVVAASIDIRPAQSTVTGNLTATGSLTVGSNNTVNGNLVGRNVEIAPAQVEVNGDVTASDTLFLGSNDAIYGDVVAGTVTLHAAKAYIGGNARVDWITLGNKGRVAGTITCNNASADAPCSCVTNNSHYDFGTAMGPHCDAAQAVGPHHIRISHDGVGLTCQPETVTLTACANAACTPPHHNDMPSVLLTPGGEDFDIDDSGVNSAATVRRTTPGIAALKAVSSPVALNPYTCVNTSAPHSTTPCNMEFSDTGFELSIANHVSDTEAGLTLRALQASGNREVCSAMPEGVRSVDFACAYVNPDAGTLPVQLGLSADSMSRCGAAGIDLAFNNAGTASMLFRYADVGRIRVDASYKPTSGSDAGLKMTGSTGVVVAPKLFRFAPITNGGTPSVANPAAANATGAVFTKAGKAFPVTIFADNASGNPTPNFGKESTRQTMSLVATSVVPAAPSNGTLSGIVAPPFIDGRANTNLDWSEVGIISIAAKLDNTYGYLGEAGNNLLTVTGDSGNVGRFIPDHFDTVVLPPSGDDMETEGVPMTCASSPLNCAGAPDGFAYSGQEFGLELTARNAKNDTTKNYSTIDGVTLAKDVVLTGWPAAGGSVQNFPAGDPRYSSTADTTKAAKAPAGNFKDGVSRTKQIYAFRVDVPPLPGSVIPPLPSNVYFRAVDADGASSLRAASAEAGLTIVSGRMLIPNNYGSELLPMTINLRAQLRNAAGAWVTNTADGGALISGSPVVPSALRFIGCTKNLVDSKTAACKAALQVAGPVGGTVNFVNGLAAFRLLAPGAGNNGSANLQFLAPGNPSNPSSVFLPSPPGQATFGIYKAGPVIYLRELH